MTALRTFVWGRAADYGEIVERTPSEAAAIPLPDWSYGFHISQRTKPVVDGFGALTDGDSVWSGEAFLARFENVEVQRSNLGFAERYLVVLKPGVCLYDSAEADQGGAIWPARLSPETQTFVAPAGYAAPFDVTFMEDQPVGAVVEEPHVLLSGLWQANYAHTIFETLSKLWSKTVRQGAMPIIWERTQPWQRELAGEVSEFRRLGMPGPGFSLNRLVNMPAPRTRYKTLYVATPRTLSAVHPTKIEHLRRLLPRTPLDLRGGMRKLYVSRVKARERRVLNEEALVSALEQNGFCGVIIEGKSVREQQRLFENATHIVLPHGAACANLLWTPPGARVIELVPRSYQHTMWWFWSKWLGHRYGRMVCSDSGVSSPYGARDMTVDVDTVLDGLAALESCPAGVLASG